MNRLSIVLKVIIYFKTKGNSMAVTLKFGDKVTVADVRKLHDMEDVVFDREWFEKTDEMNRDMYYMFGDLARSDSDLEIIKSRHLRYDITKSLPECSGRSILKPLATTTLKFREQTSPILRLPGA